VNRLGGTGRLGDELYLIAHHEVTGKPHLQPRALGLGLAAGLLGELMLAGSVGVGRGAVIPGRPAALGDELARRVLGQVAGEREHVPLAGWLMFLGGTAAGDIARRLAGSGYLAPAPARRLGRGRRWVPVDADSAFAPLVRVKAALDSSRPVPDVCVLLGGLASACGLGHQLSLYLPPGTHQRLADLTRRLDPGGRELIAATQAAVDSALLAHRV
jgi:Golgi phosphoprotein 3 (GPP34)